MVIHTPHLVLSFKLLGVDIGEILNALEQFLLPLPQNTENAQFHVKNGHIAINVLL